MLPFAKFRKYPSLSLCLLPFALALQTPAKPLSSPLSSKPRPEAQTAFAEILASYQFVSDFRSREAERPISLEFFWRYPFPLPKAYFPIDHNLGDKPQSLPLSPGQDKAIEHLNYGRVLFREKNYEEARKVWLTARAKYGQNFPFHRRNDFFIALAFLKISESLRKMFQGDTQRSEVRLSYANTATFLSWAFIKKRELDDPELDPITPEALYNLSAIYYEFDRYNGAHSTALEGLNFLRRTGRREKRGEFRRLIAETWIRDRQYLEAVKEFDTLIRQEQDPLQAAQAFARVADIYFDLNNYELAEDAYQTAQRLDAQIGQIIPLSFILRGEALFWLGRFDESQQNLQFGIDSVAYKQTKAALSSSFRSWAALRIADAFLARFRQAKEHGHLQEAAALLAKTRLAYYRVSHEHPRTEAAEIAKIREACLSLPVYEGNNVRHGRELLAASLQSPLPLQAIELAQSCEVLSYGEREKNAEYVEKVSAFYKRFPQSRFLGQFIGPLKAVQATHLDAYLDALEYHKGIKFYETYAKLLFPSLTPARQKKLFIAYLETKQADKAAPFWQAFQAEEGKSAEKLLRSLVYFADMAGKKPGPSWAEATTKLLEDEKSWFKFPSFPWTGRVLSLSQRLLKSPLERLHLPWLLELYKGWAKNDPKPICEMVYPLLSRRFALLAGESPQEAALLWQEVVAITQQQLPKLFAKSLECSKALLHLEAQLARQAAVREGYAQLWLERSKWPQKAVIVPLMWQAAEMLNENSNAATLQEQLWSYVSRQDAKKFPESTYAKARLDKIKTEYEELWQPTLKVRR